MIRSALQAEAEQCLMLLLLGELGRVSDLSAFPEVERLVVGALSAGSEDVKATASLALGGVAVGNVHRYLPLLLTRAADVDRASPKQLYLLLKSLNEVLRTLLAKSIQMQPGALLLCRAPPMLRRIVRLRQLLLAYLARLQSPLAVLSCRPDLTAGPLPWVVGACVGGMHGVVGLAVVVRPLHRHGGMQSSRSRYCSCWAATWRRRRSAVAWWRTALHSSPACPQRRWQRGC